MLEPSASEKFKIECCVNPVTGLFPKVRVLSLEPVFPPDAANGRSIHVYELVRNLAGQGHQVHIFSTWAGGDLSAPGITCSPISARNIPFLYLQYIVTILYLSLFKRYDVVYTRNTLFGVLGAFFFKTLRRTKLVCEVNGIADDEFDLEWSRNLTAGSQETPKSSIRDRMNRQFAKFSERYIVDKADAVVAVTEGIKTYLVDRYGLPEMQVSVIANGANTDIFSPRDRHEARCLLGLPVEDRYVCFVGNFAPWQGVEYLIQAVPEIVSRYPCVRILLVGDGAMRQAWAALADSVGALSHIRFTGAVPYEDVVLYIGASDICVAPFISRRNERIGLSPLKIYEYLACGRPVVASRINGITELLTRSGGGIAVAPEDPRELAGAVLHLLSNESLQRKMGCSGCAYVTANHTWEKVAANVAGILANSTNGVPLPLDAGDMRQGGSNE